MKVKLPPLIVFSVNKISTIQLFHRQSIHWLLQKPESEIIEAKKMAVAHSTVVDTNYCIRLWDQWSSHQATACGDSIASLMTISPKELAHHMSNFIFELRKKDGSEFPPNTVHHIVSGTQRFVRWNNNATVDYLQGSGVC